VTDRHAGGLSLPASPWWALVIVGFAVHVLFSTGLLVAGAIVAWIKFRPRRSQR